MVTGGEVARAVPVENFLFYPVNIFISKLFCANKGFSHRLGFYSTSSDWAILSTIPAICLLKKETFELSWVNGTAGNMRDWHQFLRQMGGGEKKKVVQLDFTYSIFTEGLQLIKRQRL